MPMFADRQDAGLALARAVEAQVSDTNVLVLALPRGGVPVAFEIAQAIHAELNIFMVRKLGAPGHEELAFGAISTGGGRVLNQNVVNELGLTERAIAEVERKERIELERREITYREDREPAVLRDRSIILADDGLATGATMMAAVRTAKLSSPKRVVVAVPVASKQAIERIGSVADQIVCLATPERFESVGEWYANFEQTTDDEVRSLLARAVPG